MDEFELCSNSSSIKRKEPPALAGAPEQKSELKNRVSMMGACWV